MFEECVPRVQHAYFSLFIQSNSSLVLLSLMWSMIKALFFFFCYRAIEILCSFACLITSELTNQRRLKALFTCSLLSSAVSSWPVTGRQLGRSLGRGELSCGTLVPCSRRKESTEEDQGTNGFPKARTTQVCSTSGDGGCWDSRRSWWIRKQNLIQEVFLFIYFIFLTLFCQSVLSIKCNAQLAIC